MERLSYYNCCGYVNCVDCRIRPIGLNRGGVFRLGRIFRGEVASQFNKNPA